MRKAVESILCMSFWTAVAAAAAVVHDQHDSGTFTDSSDNRARDSHSEIVKLLAPPGSVTATPLSASTVRLQWSPGSLGDQALSFTIERAQKSPRRTRFLEAVEDDVKYYTNTTICVRERRKDTEHFIVLESEPTCLSNVRGLPPRNIKPIYVAFVELVALSLVVSAITCIFVHFALELLKRSLRSPEQCVGTGDRPYEECLKGWLREDEDDKEPDERSRIINASRATSV